MTEEQKQNIKLGYYKPDNLFTRKARLLQSYHRVMGGELRCGTHKTKTKNSGEYKDEKLGNILIDGRQSKKNFILESTYRYAEYRVGTKLKDETIEAKRLFNNMLSSQPMAFNLFHPLMIIGYTYPAELDMMIKSAFPKLPIAFVYDIKLEFIPQPISLYINDRTAMDAYIAFIDDKRNKYCIAIEVKYTDTLGQNQGSSKTEALQIAKDLNIFTELGLKAIEKKCSQLYRNFLLAEKYAQVEKFKDVYSVILSPEKHPTTLNDFNTLKDAIKPEYHYKLRKVSLEDFTIALQQNCPEEYQNWLYQFRERYLNFSLIEHLL